MGDNNENNALGSVIHSPTSILDIPNEPFGIICSFLDTSSLMNMCLMCQKFNSYIKSETSLQEWKKRAKDIWSDAAYPILSPANPDKLFWRMSCEALYEQKGLWTQNTYSSVRIVTQKYKREGEYPFSSLLLICKHDDTAYIAAKGHNLFYTNINSEHSNGYIENAHGRPIKDLTILNDKIYSCSTDNEPIKSWKLINSHLQMETSYNFDSGPSEDWPTCLSSYPEQDVFAVGSLYGSVSVFDSRSRDRMYRYKVRSKDGYQVHTLAMNSEYILSAVSYDHIVSVYDQRARRIIKETEIPPSLIQEVTCIKMQQDCVLIGDYFGKLHVLDPKNDFKLVKSYNIGHTYEIKGVRLTYGNLITSSTNKVIISSPTDPPKHMFTLKIPYIIKKMDYQNGTLALASHGNQVQIYQFVQ